MYVRDEIPYEEDKPKGIRKVLHILGVIWELFDAVMDLFR